MVIRLTQLISSRPFHGLNPGVSLILEDLFLMTFLINVELVCDYLLENFEQVFASRLITTLFSPLCFSRTWR